jgi:DNA-binding NtrC family response regulator
MALPRRDETVLAGTRSLVRELQGLICAIMESRDRRRREVRFSLKEIADRAAAETERQAIRLALHATRGNKSEAARLLRVDYKTLHLKMKRYGIEAAEFRAS